MPRKAVNPNDPFMTVETAQMRCVDMLRAEWEDASDRTDMSLGEALKKEPSRVLAAMGMQPDPWQLELLTTDANRILTLCSRQSGKSHTAAAMALREALVNPPAEVLIVSRAQRQSFEVLRKAKDMYLALQGARVKRRVWNPKTLKHEVAGYDAALSALQNIRVRPEDMTQGDNAQQMTFNNGSRIISLPGSAETIVGYSAISLLIIDEAARTQDVLYSSLSPMRAVSRGRLVALSTPFGRRGWFWEAWKRCDEAEARGEPSPWKRFKITASECPRISKEFLEEEKFDLGSMWYSQEYECTPPEAPVWMADYSFRPIGDVRSGDVVIGWRRMPALEGRSYGKDCLTRSQVLGVRRSHGPLVQITLESGSVIRCTPDHKWWVLNTQNYTTSYGPAKVGCHLCRVIEPTKPLPDHLQWDAAWLGGIYDGEGCSDFIAQSESHNPAICARIEQVLESLGFRAVVQAHGFYFMGQERSLKKQAMVDFLNWTRPTKVGNGMDRIILSKHFRRPDRVVDIAPAGESDVVCMQTTTGNYVVWGYASKNCVFTAVVNSVFSHDDIAACLDDSVKPLFVPVLDLPGGGIESPLDPSLEELRLYGVDYETGGVV